MKKYSYILILLSFFISCQNPSKHSTFHLFPRQEKLTEISCHFDEDKLGRIEALQCNDSSLIAFDYHSGFSFTLFDLNSDSVIGRFGKIGQGPDEILLGCYGYLFDGSFTINYDIMGFLAKYPIDSLWRNTNYKPLKLAKYEIKEAQFSRVIPLSDTTFLGAGTYRDKFQFVLFDNHSYPIDFGVEIYNWDDSRFNSYHKYLSNQGILDKHPVQSKFVYAVNNSSNIDFIQIVNDSIKRIKSLRLRNPQGEPQQEGVFNRVIPDLKSPLGYIDITTTSNYVYALYTENLFVGEDGKGNSRSSNTVLVFDWEGNPVKQLKLNKDAYFIAANTKNKRIYAAVKNEESGWSITSYHLNEP
jgi:hypothetical protein